jgi:hypothetical protein
LSLLTFLKNTNKRKASAPEAMNETSDKIITIIITAPAKPHVSVLVGSQFKGVTAKYIKSIRDRIDDIILIIISIINIYKKKCVKIIKNQAYKQC